MDRTEPSPRSGSATASRGSGRPAEDLAGSPAERLSARPAERLSARRAPVGPPSACRPGPPSACRLAERLSARPAHGPWMRLTHRIRVQHTWRSGDSARTGVRPRLPILRPDLVASDAPEDSCGRSRRRPAHRNSPRERGSCGDGGRRPANRPCPGPTSALVVPGRESCHERGPQSDEPAASAGTGAGAARRPSVRFR